MSSTVLSSDVVELIEALSIDRPSTRIPSIIWVEGGPDDDPKAVLKGTLLHRGANLRALAIAVRIAPVEADFDYQMEFDGNVPHDIEALWLAFGMQGHCETIEIGGRRYAMFVHPFCE